MKDAILDLGNASSVLNMGIPLADGAPDMQLVRISLINWYAFSQEDIDVVGNVSFIGPNGAGKSSVIDAIQLVLTGANKNLFKANATADRISGDVSHEERRSVFDYCVGKVAGQTLRDTSITCLSLSFRSVSTGRTMSMGLMLSARADEGRETMLGSFTVKDIISTDDFLMVPDGPDGSEEGVDQADAAKVTRTWDEFTKHLRSRYGSAKVKASAGAHKEHFVRTALPDLAGREFDTSAYLEALRKALAFRKMDDPSEFVRRMILPRPELTGEKVSGCKKDFDNYRELEERIEALGSEIDEIGVLRSRAVSIERQRSSLVAHMWARLTMRAQSLKGEAESLKGNVDRKTADIAQAQSLRSKVRNDLMATSLSLESLENSSDNADIIARSDKLAQDISHLERRRDTEQAEADRLLEGASSLGGMLPLLGNLSGLGLLDQLKDTHLALELYVSKIKDRSFKTDQTAFAVDMIEGIIEQSSEKERFLIGEGEMLKRDNAADVALLREADRSGRLLSPQVVDLLDTLSDMGIEAKPLCSLAEVSDPQWRDAVETLIGRKREAIIAHPSDVSRIIRLVHDDRSRFGSCMVFDSKDGGISGRTPSRDVLSSVVRFTDDPLARFGRELVENAIGGMIMVDDPESLRDHRMATTRNVMVKQGGIIGFRSRPRDLLMGMSTSSVGVQELRDRVGSALERISDIDKSISDLRSLLDSARNALITVKRLETLEPVLKELDKLHGDIATRKVRHENLIASIDKDIIEGIEKARKRKASLTIEADDLDADVARLIRASSEEEARMKRANAALGEVESEIEDMDVDADICSEGRDLIARTSGTPKQVEAGIANLESRIRSAEQGWNRDVGAYVSKSLTEVPAMEGFDETLAWLSDRHRDLSCNVLIQYREKAREVRRMMSMTIINEIMVDIASDIEKGKAKIREINAILKQQVFGAEFYAFTASDNPEFSDLLKLADAAMRRERDLDDLFDQTMDEDDAFSDDPVARGFRKMRHLFEGRSDDIDALADYRNFLRFDLISKDAETGNMLSDFSGQQKRSGGERQIPFYVAIGTAITSVLHRGSNRSGFGLGMFDEAFNALDTRNTGVSLNLLANMGMQWIVSAPTDKYVPLARESQTIINITRDGTFVQLDPEYPTGEARMVLNEKAEEAIRAEERKDVALETQAVAL